MSYTALHEPDVGPLRRLVRGRRGLAAGVAVVAILVTATAAYLARPAAAAPHGSNAADTAVAASTPATQTQALGGVPSASSSLRPSASPSSAGSTTAPVIPATGWIPVDQAAWKAEVDAYNALKTDPVPAGVGTLAEFRADCTYSHSLQDDPIVAPGIPGASHMHTFVGNEATNANTAAGDLTRLTATTCKPVLDHSSYWVPTLYDNETGTPVQPTGFRVYYRSLMNTSANQLPMPAGLRMISGDAKKKVPTPRGSQGQFYCAFYGPGDLDGVARSTNGNWPICGDGATLHFMLRFPDCWDGKHLDSPNHKDHVAYGANNACPADHPVKIPSITFDITYGVKGTAAGYFLSSDPEGKSASSMHGDAFVMWDTATMNKRTKDCILQRRTCDDNGYES